MFPGLGHGLGPKSRPEISRLDPLRGQTHFYVDFPFVFSENLSNAFSDPWNLPARTLSMTCHYFHELFLEPPWYIHAIPSDLNASSIRCLTLPNLGNTRVLGTQGASSRKSVFLLNFRNGKPHNLVNVASIPDHIQKQLNNKARRSHLNGSQDFLVPLSWFSEEFKIRASSKNNKCFWSKHAF